MRCFATASLLSTLLFAAVGAQAASTAELKVAGVIKPPACAPAFSGGSTIDYGTITASSLNQTAPTLLEEKSVTFTVTCESSARISVKAIDNRASSVVPGLIANVPAKGWSGSFPDNWARGLGLVAGKKVGVYNLRLQQDTFTGDGKTVDLIVFENAKWGRSGGGNFPADGSQPQSFAAPNTTTPGAYKAISGSLSVQVVIDKASNLPLPQEIPLDGSSTLEVNYL